MDSKINKQKHQMFQELKENKKKKKDFEGTKGYEKTIY